MIIVSPISTDSSFFIFSKIFEKATPIKSPNMIPPNIIPVKLITPEVIPIGVTCPSKRIHKITRKSARAVPSLKILSPSNIRVNRRGAQTLLNIESTATGSVAEIRDPNSRHTIKGICKPKNGNT